MCIVHHNVGVGSPKGVPRTRARPGPSQPPPAGRPPARLPSARQFPAPLPARLRLGGASGRWPAATRRRPAAASPPHGRLALRWAPPPAPPRPAPSGRLLSVGHRARAAEGRRTAGSGQRRVVPARPTVPAAEGLGGFRSRQGASRQERRPALPHRRAPFTPTPTPPNQVRGRRSVASEPQGTILRGVHDELEAARDARTAPSRLAATQASCQETDGRAAGKLHMIGGQR